MSGAVLPPALPTRDHSVVGCPAGGLLWQLGDGPRPVAIEATTRQGTGAVIAHACGTRRARRRHSRQDYRRAPAPAKSRRRPCQIAPPPVERALSVGRPGSACRSTGRMPLGSPSATLAFRPSTPIIAPRRKRLEGATRYPADRPFTRCSHRRLAGALTGSGRKATTEQSRGGPEMAAEVTSPVASRPCTCAAPAGRVSREPARPSRCGRCPGSRGAL